MNKNLAQLRANLSVDLAAIGVLVALTAIVAAGGVLPVLSARAAQRDLHDQLESDRAATRQLRSKQAEFELNLARLEGELKATRVEVEPVGRLNSRLSRLTESASLRKLALDRVAPEAPQRTPKATLVPIRIEGRGAFLASRDWMADLRVEFPDVEIAGFQIARERFGTTDSSSFSFDLVWYAAPSAPAEKAAPKK